MTPDEQDTLWKYLSEGNNTAYVSRFEGLLQALEQDLLGELDEVNPPKVKEDDLIVDTPGVEKCLLDE